MNTIANENSVIQNNEKKLYTKGWVLLGTYFGGPLAGCYMVSKNFEALGQKELAQKVFRIGIITTILFGALVFIPESITDKIPNYSIIPFIYTVVICCYCVQKQGEAIDEHIKNGGQKYSGWKVTGIGILSLIILLAYFFALVLLLPENLIG